MSKPLAKLALGAIVCAGVVGGAISGSASPGSSLPARVVTAPSSGFGENVTLKPPPTYLLPRLSADSAVSIVKDSMPDAKITSTTPQLALFSWTGRPVDADGNPTGPPYYEDAPAWVVTVQGVCLAVDEQGCANDTMNAVVDASTGAFVIGYPADEPIESAPLASG